MDEKNMSLNKKEKVVEKTMVQEKVQNMHVFQEKEGGY